MAVFLARDLVQPVGMARRLLGLAPFVEHQRRDTGQFLVLVFGADIGRKLNAVAVRIEEIDRLEDAVMRRPEDIDALA